MAENDVKPPVDIDEETVRLLDQDDAFRASLDEALNDDQMATDAAVPQKPPAVTPYDYDAAAKAKRREEMKSWLLRPVGEDPPFVREAIHGIKQAFADATAPAPPDPHEEAKKMLLHSPDEDPEWLKSTGRAVKRGALAAVHQGATAFTDAMAWGYKESGLYKVIRPDEEGQKAFLDWYALPSNQREVGVEGTDTTLVSSQQNWEKWAGPRSGGGLGFVESLSQFGTGMAISSRMLKNFKGVPLVGPALEALDKTKLLRGGLTGIVTDLTFFDPYEKRLSSFLVDGPDWFGKPATEYIFRNLAPKEDDGKAMARVKNALEGYLTGMALEGVLGGLKLARMKYLARKGELTEEALAKEVVELRKEFPHLFDEKAPVPNAGPAQVVQTPDGFHEVQVDIPEADVVELAPGELPPPKPSPGALEIGSEGTPRPLDFEHVKTTSEEIIPDIFTVGRGEGGKNVIRVIQNGVDGATPKVFEMPFDDPAAAETLRKLREKNPSVQTHTPLRGDSPISDEHLQFWWDNAVKDPDLGNTSVGAPKERPPVNSDATNTSAAGPRAGKRTVESRSTSRGKAEVEAATFNMSVKNLAKKGQFVDENAKKVFQEALAAYKESGDPRSVADLLDAYGFNAGYIQQPQDVINALKGLVDAKPEAQAIARNKPRTWAELREAAAKMFPEMDDDAALNAASKMFGGVEHLPEQLLATRAWMWYQAGQISKLSKLADAFPENAKVADQLMAAMDTLFQVHAHVTGATTKTAQALQGLQMPLGEVTAELAAARAGATEGKAAATAEVKAGSAVGSEDPTIVKPQDAAKEPPRPLTVADKLANAVKAGKLSHRAPNTYELATSLSRQEVVALSKLVSLADGNLDVMLKLINGPKHADLAAHAAKVPPETLKSWGKFINTYRAEALLSGVTTQLGNVLSNLGVAIKRPIQHFWAGFRENDKVLMDEGADMLSGLVHHWYESAGLAVKAFKQGENIFDSGFSYARAATGTADGGLLNLEAAALKRSGGLTPGNLMHTMFRMPSRLLLTADEFFKQLNGRAFTRAQVMREARLAGITDKAILEQRVRDSMKVAFDPNGGAVFPNALKYAQENTFTEELGPVAKKWQEAIQSTELGRFVVPFYKTPANIFAHAWQEAPGLNLLNKQLVADLNAGGRRAALARAKADFGAVMWGMAAWLALQGKVTGSGPTDPELRKRWLEAGNQPYSLRFGDSQFSFRRGDPFTTSLGMVADFVQMSGDLDENSKLSASAALMATLANNVTNKTFMQGLSDFLDAVSSGNVKDTQSFISNAAGSFIPNIVNRGNPDDIQREARGILDSLKARVPGLSTELEPRRNIFGERVMRAPGWANRFFNPYTYMGTPSNEDAQVELLKLGKAMSMPPETWSKGRIDLRDRELYVPSDPKRAGQSPYDRLLEMRESPPWGGLNLRARVERLMANKKWQEASDSDALGPGGLKYQLVASLIEGYDKTARGYLYREYPALLTAVQQAKLADGAAVKGGREAAQAALDKYEQLFLKQ